ncbi:alpha/beta fold hydrolase [Hymenobacter rubripertinctus]|uniref:Alpha/beta hydrolase n=1 Tax=Hymenobacter rubripertinctus TaxID=2029981 RepID=A0A418QQ29_9BACT|nr:alpha/beta hydrolase [Hymenobacter rubripertinctus]RIY07232.1 alpha/beta hydrolase [Hymenobacter rubripertinctus]
MNLLKNTAYSLLALSSAIVAGLVLFTHRTARKVRAALPPSGSFVDLPHGRLHVREQGAGPVLLLVHGLGGQMGQFNYAVAERLAEDFRVVVVDRPGSGYSAALASSDLASQADALAELITRLELGRPLVVGHSLGGAVVLALALNHPKLVSGLALISPLAALPETVPAIFQRLLIPSRWKRQLVAWTVATPLSIRRSPQVMQALFRPETPPRDYATRGGGMLSLQPAQFLATIADLEFLPSYLPTLTARFPDLRLPVRVLYGRHDAVLDWQLNGQALTENIPGATLRLIEGGHMLPITQPELVARFIRETALAESEAVK